MRNRELDTLEETILKVVGSSDEAIGIDELAMKTGESKDKILQKLQDEEFNEMFVEAVSKSFIKDLPQIAKAFSEKAKAGQFQHGKLIFEMVGMYKEKKEVDTNIGLSDNINPFESDKEKEDFLKATLDKYKKEGSDDG